MADYESGLSIDGQYADLATAVAVIGSNTRTLIVRNALTVSADLTIPENIKLWFTTGVINVSSGKTLTIKGGIEAPVNRQLFAGAGSVKFGHAIFEAFVTWFGAKLDGVTNDAAAAQKAIDAWQPSGDNSPKGGIVTVTGPMAIGSSLNMFANPVTLRGKGGFGGGGYAVSNAYNTYIKSLPALAGSPMVLMHSMGPVIKNLHFIGDTAHKPSAAIEMSESGPYFSDMACIEDCWIGPMYGWSDDGGGSRQFVNGLLWSGSVDSDTNLASRVMIVGADVGVNLTNPNASITHFETIQTIGCGRGIKSVVPQVLVRNWACAANDVDYEMAGQGNDVTLINYVSEGSGRMIIGNAIAPFRVTVIGGGFQCDGNVGAKFHISQADYDTRRAFIQFAGLAAVATSIKLTHFNLTQTGFATVATPVIEVSNAPGGATALHLVVDECDGITAKNINVGSDNYQNSTRIVELTQQTYSGGGPNLTRFIQNSTNGSTGEDDTFADARWDTLGMANFYGGPVKIKKLPTPTINVATVTGGGSTNRYYCVVALTRDGHSLRGASQLVTAAATLDASHYVDLIWLPCPGAYAYIVARGTSAGSEQPLVTLGLSDLENGNFFRDDGSHTPSGALPTNSNTTGNLYIDGGTGIRSKAGDPVATDLMDGCSAVFKNTSTGAIKLWVNDGGTMKSGPALS